MAAEKEYTVTFTLVATTPTYDLESVPQEFKDISFITQELLMQTVKQFIGEISQVPPIHSAIKQEGKRVYLLARKGADIKLQPRKVSIYEFELTNIKLPVISFRL